jgi:hypothetical protein
MENIMALVGTPNQNGAPATGTPVEKEADFKASKKAAADRHAAKVKEERQKDHEMFLAIRDETKTNGSFDKFPQEVKDYILAKCVPPAERIGHTGPSFFTQIFGDKPTVGQSVTLNQVITKTFKGMDTISASIKKWAQKGVVVDTQVNKQNMLETKYIITKLPNA